MFVMPLALEASPIYLLAVRKTVTTPWLADLSLPARQRYAKGLPMEGTP